MEPFILFELAGTTYGVRSRVVQQIEMIDDVCRGVVTAWRATATDEDRRRVLSERPFIPSDLDRTLLTDLSARLGVYDIPDELRYRLREQFWDAMDELGR